MVRNFRQNNSDIQVHEVDIENNDNYLQDVRDIVRKQRKILIVGPYELREKVDPVIYFLKQNNLQVESFIEQGDVHTDLQYNMGQNTKEVIKGIIQDLSKKSGIIILLTSEDVITPTILQIAYTIARRNNCFVKSYDISTLDKNMLKQVSADIIYLINS